MVYNDLIFIHIPKTGGSSIRGSLSKNYKLLYNSSEENFLKLGFSKNENFENYKFSIYKFNDHLPLQLIKRNKLEKNKYIFTFVRNPFSRMVSLYHESINNPLINIEQFTSNKKISFEHFVNLVTENSYWFTIPMIDYIGIKNIEEVNFIGRFENFENDILRLKKKIKIKIKHHNFNNHIKSKLKFSDYRKFYSNYKVVDMVQKYYEKDLNKFNYDYDQFLKFEKNKIKLSTIFFRLLKRKIINIL